MTNLINQDGAGNTFYNYITPVIRGENSNFAGTIETLMTTAGWGWGSDSVYRVVRPPAPGIETRSGSPLTTANSRFYFNNLPNPGLAINNSPTNGSTTAISSSLTSANVSTDVFFMIANQYAFCMASFTSFALTSLRFFYYGGYLREPSFTGNTSPLGFIGLNSQRPDYYRPFATTGTAKSTLSTAADAITSPPIVCTPGTTPGVGEATFTDVVIRDAAAPNNPVGKLWNCIDMPASCNVGELWRNTGAYDADGSTSEQDVYLCVMPWGERKLGMRVWTENVA